jgi:hypothetical protein
MAIEKVINIVAHSKQALDDINKLYSKLQETEKAQVDLNEDAEAMGDAYKEAGKESVKAIEKQSKAMKGLPQLVAVLKKALMQ